MSEAVSTTKVEERVGGLEREEVLARVLAEAVAGDVRDLAEQTGVSAVLYALVNAIGDGTLKSRAVEHASRMAVLEFLACDHVYTGLDRQGYAALLDATYRYVMCDTPDRVWAVAASDLDTLNEQVALAG